MIPTKKREPIFIILIPLFILLFSFVFDIVLIKIEDSRVEATTKEIVTELLTTNSSNYKERAKTFYEKKSINTELLEIVFDTDNNAIYLYNSHPYGSFFGKIIGINSYRAEVTIKAHLEGEQVIIEDMNQDELFEYINQFTSK